MILEEPKVQALKLIRQRLPQGGHILDIGFGKGHVLERLLDLGYIVAGTEISEPMLEEVGERLKGRGCFHLYHTEDPTTVVEPVDCTVCFEVIEHLEDPTDFLKSFPPGLIYFSTPNAGRWWVKLSRGAYEPWDFPPNHLKRYNKDSLKVLLQDCGFEDITVWEMPVRYHELLQPFYSYLAFKLGLKTNTPCYEHVRNHRGGLGTLVELVRRGSWPVTRTVAALLNRTGFVGTNLLAEARKR